MASNIKNPLPEDDEIPEASDNESEFLNTHISRVINDEKVFFPKAIKKKGGILCGGQR